MVMTPRSAEEVGTVDDDPVAQHGTGGDPAVQDSHDHQVVAGKELSAGEDDHDEASGKEDPGHESSQSVRIRTGEQIEGSHVGGESRHCDVGAGSDAQKEHGH